MIVTSKERDWPANLGPQSICHILAVIWIQVIYRNVGLG